MDEYSANLSVWKNQLALHIRHLGTENLVVPNNRATRAALLRAFERRLHRSSGNCTVRDGEIAWCRMRIRAAGGVRIMGTSARGILGGVLIPYPPARHQGLDFDLACGLHFDEDGSMTHAHPRHGQRAMEIWPYFSHHPVALTRLWREDSVGVAACERRRDLRRECVPTSESQCVLSLFLLASPNHLYRKSDTPPSVPVGSPWHFGTTRRTRKCLTIARAYDALAHGAEAAAPLRQSARLALLIRRPARRTSSGGCTLRGWGTAWCWMRGGGAMATSASSIGGCVDYQLGCCGSRWAESMGGFLTSLVSRSISRLLDTKGANFAFACSLDFDDIGLYDTWLIRDSRANAPRNDPTSRTTLAPSPACAARSPWKSRRAGTAPRSRSELIPPSQSHFPTSFPPGSPLAFRGDTPHPDQRRYVVSSLPLILPLASASAALRLLRRLPLPPLLPSALLLFLPLPLNTLPYTAQKRLYHGMLTPLRLTCPWRVVREDWNELPLFWWVSDYHPLKSEACPFERDGMVKEGHCGA
ncbi:hypothetical protein DFH06DRAFT_1352726 [Mycena polygramma]|nr:hypothetical protein DFH06DRAFT_1352726 [Mycena polygramma]